jgi:hypothetical protein
VLYETFGRCVIGLQISRWGDGPSFERRPVNGGVIPVCTVGRSYLLELLHSQFQARQMRMVDGPMARRACEQLTMHETEQHDTGIVYRCPARTAR